MMARWINTAKPHMSDNIVCSNCGYNSIARYNFCPICGAKMEEGKKPQSVTNADMFREVFGFKPTLSTDMFPCLAPRKVCDAQENECDGCPFYGWWLKEYKACFEIKPEFEGVE